MIEVNGPANILFHIQVYQHHPSQVHIDLTFIEHELQKTIYYMRRHDAEPAIKWHEACADFEKGARL